MNPAHKPDEERLFGEFRRLWSGAGEIANADIKDRPDVQGSLVGGRRFGMEIASLTEDTRARSDGALRGSLARELEAGCAAAGISASFGVSLLDFQADRLVDRAHRARAVALLVQLAKEAGDRPLNLGERTLGMRGIGDLLSGAVIEPNPEGFGFYFTRSGRGLGAEFIRERIARKDKRVAEYRAALGNGDPALWLLLVAAATLASSVRRPSTAEIFETRFDRVFFMECWQSAANVVELTTRKLQPGSDP